MQILEAVFTDKIIVPDIKCIPTVADLEHINNYKQRWESRVDTKKWDIANPRILVNSTKDSYKQIRYFFAAIMINYDALITEFSRVLKQIYNKQEISTIADFIKQNLTQEIKKAIEIINNPSKFITEAIEKHDTLNKKLFSNNKLKKQVKNKILDIVEEFKKDLVESNVELDVRDVVLIGSNVNYNYTKDSDLDVHIEAELKSDCPEEIYQALYGAYRSLFNKKFDIDFYGIPVELYVETESTARVSNGIYSVLKDKWLQEPKKEEIPEIDQEKFKKLYDEWEQKCTALFQDFEKDKLDNESKIIKLIEQIYELRKQGLVNGEYDLKNLVFKELRNNGHLDKLKDYKNKIIAKRLSLQEDLNNQELFKIQDEIFKIAKCQPSINANGYFHLYNIREKDLNNILNKLRNLAYVESANAAGGKWDFNHFNTMQLPQRYFNITGKIKLEK